MLRMDFILVDRQYESIVRDVVAVTGIDLFPLVRYWQEIHQSKQLPPGVTDREMQYLLFWSTITPPGHKFHVAYDKLPKTLDEFKQFSEIEQKRENSFEPLPDFITFSNEIPDFWWTLDFVNQVYKEIFGSALYEENADHQTKTEAMETLTGKMFIIYNTVICCLGSFWTRLLAKIPVSYALSDGQVRSKSLSLAMKTISSGNESSTYASHLMFWKKRMSVVMLPPCPLPSLTRLSFQLNQTNEDYVSFTGINFLQYIIKERLQFENMRGTGKYPLFSVHNNPFFYCDTILQYFQNVQLIFDYLELTSSK